MKIGIFGGTFDPPHIAHQILAAEALSQIHLDLILWVLTPFPPHKIEQKITPLEHRIKMVEFSIEENHQFSLSRVDIDRDPPQFAVDTVKILKKHYPHDEIYYLMGMDSLNDLSTWYQPAGLVKICDGIVVMKRVGEILNLAEVVNKYPDLGEKILILDTPNIEISSSDIRRRIISGIEYRYFVPAKVYRYILKNHLYLD